MKDIQSITILTQKNKYFFEKNDRKGNVTGLTKSVIRRAKLIDKKLKTHCINNWMAFCCWSKNID